MNFKQIQLKTLRGAMKTRSWELGKSREEITVLETAIDQWLEKMRTALQNRWMLAQDAFHGMVKYGAMYHCKAHKGLFMRHSKTSVACVGPDIDPKTYRYTEVYYNRADFLAKFGKCLFEIE